MWRYNKNIKFNFFFSAKFMLPSMHTESWVNVCISLNSEWLKCLLFNWTSVFVVKLQSVFQNMLSLWQKWNPNWMLVNDYPPKPVHELKESIVQLNNTIMISQKAAGDQRWVYWGLMWWRRFTEDSVFMSCSLNHIQICRTRESQRNALFLLHTARISWVAINIDLRGDRQNNHLLCEMCLTGAEYRDYAASMISQIKVI